MEEEEEDRPLTVACFDGRAMLSRKTCVAVSRLLRSLVEADPNVALCDARATTVKATAVVFAMHATEHPYLFYTLRNSLLRPGDVASFMEACEAIQFLQAESDEMLVHMCAWAHAFLPAEAETVLGGASLGFAHRVGMLWSVEYIRFYTLASWKHIGERDMAALVADDDLNAPEEDILLLAFNWAVTTPPRRKVAAAERVFAHVRFPFVRRDYVAFIRGCLKTHGLEGALDRARTKHAACVTPRTRSILRRFFPTMRPRRRHAPSRVLDFLFFDDSSDVRAVRFPGDGDRVLVVAGANIHLVTHTFDGAREEDGLSLTCDVVVELAPYENGHAFVNDSVTFCAPDTLFFVSQSLGTCNMHTVRLSDLRHKSAVVAARVKTALSLGHGLVLCAREKGNAYDVLLVEEDGELRVESETDMHPVFCADELVAETTFCGTLVMLNAEKCFAMRAGHAAWDVFQLSKAKPVLARVVSKKGLVLVLYDGELDVWDVCTGAIVKKVAVPTGLTRVAADYLCDWAVLCGYAACGGSAELVTVDMHELAVKRTFSVHPQVKRRNGLFCVFGGAVALDYELYDVGI